MENPQNSSVTNGLSWRLLFPVGWELLGASVVPGESVDSGLDQNEPVFRVDVLPELLEVFSDVQSLFNQAVEILWDLGSAACSLNSDQKNKQKYLSPPV